MNKEDLKGSLFYLRVKWQNMEIILLTCMVIYGNI